MLAIRRLDKSFVLRRGAIPARVLAGIDLDIGKGELFCLLGASGCGKTTLLNILAGFETPTHGDLRLDGAPITRAGRDRVVFFQNADAALFPWLTAEENVAFGLRIAGVPPARRAQVVEQHLRLVGLWDDRAKYPRQLSGGMKQRIQIARGLAIDPAILLMDEPFAALDAITRRFMHAELLHAPQQQPHALEHQLRVAAALDDEVAFEHALRPGVVQRPLQPHRRGPGPRRAQQLERRIGGQELHQRGRIGRPIGLPREPRRACADFLDDRHHRVARNLGVVQRNRHFGGQPAWRRVGRQRGAQPEAACRGCAKVHLPGHVSMIACRPAEGGVLNLADEYPAGFRHRDAAHERRVGRPRQRVGP